MSTSNNISIIPVEGIPEIKPNDDLVSIVLDAASKQDISIENGDIVVFAQKIVSKSEGRVVRLDKVEPSAFAENLARELNKDSRIMEVILGETRRVVKMDRRSGEDARVFVAETRGGVVVANAGVDASNVSGGDSVTLLPLNSDESAKGLAEDFKELLGVDIAVIITDTVGRPWREGLTEIAIGCWGIEPLRDYRGQKDNKGYGLTATVVAIADEIASAAGLAMDKTGSVPVVVIRGYTYESGEKGAKQLVRDREEDLFR